MIASGICRPIIFSTFCLVHVIFFSLLGTLAGWNCCCGASEIAQTAHTVCVMVVFLIGRMFGSMDGCMDKELIDGC